MRYLLPHGNTLIVRGAASIQLLHGEATVLGAPMQPQMKIVVRKEKQIPLESQTEAEFEVNIGRTGEIFEAVGSTIPRSWREAANALAELEQGKVAILGMSDVGKSTLCTFLSNELRKSKHQTCIIDGDIGQADIGPPTTIGITNAHKMIHTLVELEPEALIFIGHTTPSRVKTKLINGIARLSRMSPDGLTLINTDGWVLDLEAVEYKIELLKTVEPDLILAIALGDELQPILVGSRAKSLCVEAARSILERSRADRRAIRNYGYHRYLAGGSQRTMNQDNIKVTVPDDLKHIWHKNPDEFQNLVAGLLDSSRLLQQIGVLLKVGSQGLRIFSRPLEDVREVEVGYVKVSTEGAELGYLN